FPRWPVAEKLERRALKPARNRLFVLQLAKRCCALRSAPPMQSRALPGTGDRAPGFAVKRRPTPAPTERLAPIHSKMWAEFAAISGDEASAPGATISSPFGPLEFSLRNEAISRAGQRLPLAEARLASRKAEPPRYAPAQANTVTRPAARGAALHLQRLAS